MTGRKKKQKKDQNNLTAEEKFLRRIKVDFASSPVSEKLKSEILDKLNRKIEDDLNPD